MKSSSPEANAATRTCACGVTFTPYRTGSKNGQRSCSAECAAAAKRAVEASKSAVKWAARKADPIHIEKRREQSAATSARPERRSAALARNITRYGISVDEHQQMLAKQEGLCAICRKPPAMTARTSQRLHIDHDHETGKVRGLLCDRCNVGLGHFRDSSKLLAAAITYLLPKETT